MPKIDRRANAHKLRGKKLTEEQEKWVAEAEKYWEKRYRHLIEPIARSRQITGDDLAITINSPR